MPNWVNNTITITFNNEKEKDDFIKKHFNEKGDFDFKTIIPMPDNIYQGCLNNKNYERYKENNWMDWSIENWGVKWNACNTEYTENENVLHIYFNSPWYEPINIYQKLFDLYPNNKIEVKFAEEEVAYYCGKYTNIPGEEPNIELYPKYSKEAYDLYIELWGETEEYHWDEKNNKLVEEEY